jgi:hypothetical protein
MTKHLAIALGALLFWNAANAQEGVLYGNVSDKLTQETLIGASVVMLQDKARGAATDLDGNYRFQLPVGTHTIICSFTGMKADTVTVQIFAGRESPDGISRCRTTWKNWEWWLFRQVNSNSVWRNLLFRWKCCVQK